MSEKQENRQKNNNELSLEEQLQALLQGITTNPNVKEKPSDEQSILKSPEDEKVESIPSIDEKSPTQKEQSPSKEETPPQSKEAEPVLDIEHPVAPSQPPRPEAGKDAPKPAEEDRKLNPLTEELATLFGAPPSTPKTTGPTNVHPKPPPPPTQIIEPVINKPVTSKPITQRLISGKQEIVSRTAPVSEPETPVAAPGLEIAFKDEIIKGARPSRPFLGLTFLQKNLISLSIEGTSLRIMSLSGNSIERWVSVPIGPRTMMEGYVSNIAGLGQVITETRQSYNINPGKVILGFTSLGAVTRTLSLPQSAKKDLTNIVPRELRRASINIDKHLINWQVLPVKQGQMQVFVIGVPKEPLLGLLEALQLARIKPVNAELKPLALARAVNKKDAIIAHGERDSLELILIVEGLPGLMRSIYLGTETTPDQVVSRLAEELERTIFFYNGTHRDHPLDPHIPVYVTGEIANYNNLINGQISLLGRDIAPLEPPLKLPDNFPTATFMVNIGLLLKMI